ncbi:MAG: DUF2071 domain-containing protein [Actinomycetota bacterium]|nr:DUF2071 domain-containing protein [Actinomycetota bacterium]
MSGREPEEDVENPASRQRWHAMTFLHWRYDVGDLQHLLPSRLVVDTCEGTGWVSITPFLMKDFRLGPLPAVPGISTFPETNVRTYVRGPDGRDGLWFFSLEADSAPTVLGASSLYGVSYQFADMTVEEGDVVTYRSKRREKREIGHDIRVRPKAACPAPSELDHWLTGRWRAYSTIAGRLTRVPVQHQPWALWDAELLHLEETLLAAAGLPEPNAEPLVQYSPGVDVCVGLPIPA